MPTPQESLSNFDSLSGRVALVTGAGSGIGRACARHLASLGAGVVAVDISEESAQKTAAETGGTAAVVDLSNLAECDKLAEHRPDIIVNNAGIQHVAPIHEFPPEKFSLIMRVMAEAPFRIVRACLPKMYEQSWGRIVNVSSVHGNRASPYKGAYVAAKHAMEGLSKVIALEGASHGVTSNCVNPAYVRTPLVENQIATQAQTHDISPEAVVSDIMLAPAAIKRLIEPEEVAEMVGYLCGPQSSFITGSSILIDGGWTAH